MTAGIARCATAALLVVGCDGVFGLRDVAVPDAGIAVPEGLVAYYPMDTLGENAAACAHDATDTGHDGACVPNVPTVGSGQIDGAFVFDGTTSIRVEPTMGLEGNAGFTFAGWFEMSTVAPACPFNRVLGVVGEDSWQLCIDIMGKTNLDTLLVPDAGAGSAETIEVDRAVTMGAWNHYALTYDGSAVKVFLDGAEVGSAAPFTFQFDGSPIVLGADLDAGAIQEGLVGALDDVRIYNRPLSVTELTELVTLTSTR